MDMQPLLAQGTEINQDTIQERFAPAQYFGTISDMVNILVPLIVFGALLVFLAMLIFAGFKVLTGGGDPEKIAEARNIGTWAIVGMILIAISYLIVQIVTYITGVELLF